jgi:hypothetical protein
MRLTKLLLMAFPLVLLGCGNEPSTPSNNVTSPSLRSAEPRYQLANQCFIARHKGRGRVIPPEINGVRGSLLVFM